MKKTKSETLDRRAFLKVSAAAGSGAVAVALLPGAAVAEDEGSGTGCDKNDKKKGYRISQHVLDYYKTAKV